MIPPYLVDWTQGHLDHARRGLEGTICDLARAHADIEIEEHIRKAVRHLNSAYDILSTKRRVGK